MSEPKTMAKTVKEPVPGLFHYHIHDDRIDHRSDAFAVVGGGTVTLIDPLPLDPAALGRLGTVGAIVVAVGGHQRSAWRYQRELKARVHAPREAAGLEGTPDATFKEGDPLPGGLRAVHAPGPGAAHYALRLDRGPGVLLVTDLLMHEKEGIVFLPDTYVEDPGRARESARRLLDLDWDTLCFGHGEPILEGGKKALRALLAGRA
jgi:glyoxylase-like metal-dependent hydrolase (beta-lactamase superfamily II)